MRNRTTLFRAEQSRAEQIKEANKRKAEAEERIIKTQGK